MKKTLAEDILDAVQDEDYSKLDKLFDSVAEGSKDELFRLLGFAEEELTGRMRTRDMAEYFTKKGVNLVWTDVNDETVLHLLNERAEPSLVEYLVELGADINAKNIDGRTPLDNVLDNKGMNFEEFKINVDFESLGYGEENLYSDKFLEKMIDLGATHDKGAEHKNYNQTIRAEYYQKVCDEKKHFENMIEIPVEQETEKPKRKNKI